MTIFCTCCKSELTAPQFYKGKPYGWTCIQRVWPKAEKSKAWYIACDLEVMPDLWAVKVHYQGKEYIAGSYLDVCRRAKGWDVNAALAAARAGESSRQTVYLAVATDAKAKSVFFGFVRKLKR